MFLSALILLLAASDTLQEPVPVQQKCMMRLIQSEKLPNRDPGGNLRCLDILTIRGRINDACAWLGVTCKNQTVTEILWDRTLKDNALDVRWLPSSVQRATLKFLRVSSVFDVRYLPGILAYLDIEGNHMEGTVDLTNLPPRMTHFLAMDNDLTGAVILTSLPPKMELLVLRRNKIHTVYGRNEELPNSLEKASFSRFYANTKYVALDGEVRDPRIILWKVGKRRYGDGLYEADQEKKWDY